MRADEWIDVSVALEPELVTWPGDPPFSIDRIMDFDRGDECRVSRVDLGIHTGTHMDAPLHFVQEGLPIDRMPIDATVGPARLIEIRDENSIKPAELMQHGLQPGERVLFKTASSRRDWTRPPFEEAFVHVSEAAASYLVEREVRSVGIDYLSVGAFGGDGTRSHQILLGAGIWLIEGLDLSKVGPGRYDLVCLPLKIAGAEGAPARVIVRRIPD